MPEITLSKDDLIKYLAHLGITDVNGGIKLPPVAKATDYTIQATDRSGTMFTTRGAAGNVIFTLPTPSPAYVGVQFAFVGVAAGNLTVTAGAGKVVTFNNAAATSVACSTAGQKIGARIEASCDGTSWILVGVTVGVTYTVA